MLLLQTISKEKATGNVAAIYNMMEERVNFIPNVAKLHTASPEFFEKFMGITNHFIDHPTLDPVLVSYIRLLVSNLEGGKYCVRLQTAFLIKAGEDIQNIGFATANYCHLELDNKRKSLVCFVMDMMYEKLENTSERMAELFELGWSEKDIYEACMLGAIQKGVVPVINGFEVDFDF